MFHSLTDISYLITDYEQRNFTVAQALFNESIKDNIVPIPWNATTMTAQTKHVPQRIIIGVSTGAGVFALVVALAFLLFLKGRNKAKSPQGRVIGTSRTFSGIKPLSNFSAQEIGRVSTAELHHDFHGVELLNQENPAGGGNDLGHDIYELPGGRKTPSSAGVSRQIKDLAAMIKTRKGRFVAQRAYNERKARGKRRQDDERKARRKRQQDAARRIPTRSVAVRPKVLNLKKALPPIPLQALVDENTLQETLNEVRRPSPLFSRSRPGRSLASGSGTRDAHSLSIVDDQPSLATSFDSSYIHQSLPPTPSSGSMIISPLSVGYVDGSPQKRRNAVVIGHRISQFSTYAKDFDIDDYQDSWVSPQT